MFIIQETLIAVMLSIISPAKSQDFETPAATTLRTQIAFQEKTTELVNLMKHYEPEEIAKLMKVSDNLAKTVFHKYLNFDKSQYNESNAKQALFAFTGDVYRSMDPNSLTDNEVEFAQKHLRIISGLYGLLKPTDLIQPYRLEMGVKIKTPQGTSLYDFWREILTQHVNELLSNHTDQSLICLASKEYSQAIDKKSLKGQWYDIDFKEHKNGQYKNIGIFAKRARGLMARYILDNKVDHPESLKKFNWQNYQFNAELSKPNHYIFTR